jgi:hypothetical protein
LTAGFYDITNLAKVGIPSTYPHFEKICDILDITDFNKQCFFYYYQYIFSPKNENNHQNSTSYNYQNGQS